MYRLLKPALFTIDPEAAHRLMLRALDLAASTGTLELVRPALESFPVSALGKTFRNPVGLAAGFDKDGAHIKGLTQLGFGFIEVGTVTPRAQPGNQRPRIFRLPKSEGIINRMGFNNSGVAPLVRGLGSLQPECVIGINIGKNRDTPLDRAVDDYRYCLGKVAHLADYVVVNLSSPNTPGLRDLQAPAQLTALLEELLRTRDALAHKPPLLVKVAPDLMDEEIVDVARVLNTLGVEGVIATNTAIARPDVVKRDASWNETGGLSGAPLHARALEVVEILRSELAKDTVIIGVGGIMSGTDAVSFLKKGATLVQLYSGLVYRGPALIPQCVAAIRAWRKAQDTTGYTTGYTAGDSGDHNL